MWGRRAGACFPDRLTSCPWRRWLSSHPNFGVIDGNPKHWHVQLQFPAVLLKTPGLAWNQLRRLSYAWGPQPRRVTPYVGALPQDSTNFKGTYGNSDYDVRHHFNAFFSLRRPRFFARGRVAVPRMATEYQPHLPHRLVPFTIHASSNTDGTAENTTRGVQSPDPFQGVSHATQQSQSRSVDQSNAYGNPPGFFRTVARNSVNAPGFGDVDFSVLRTYRSRKDSAPSSASSFFQSVQPRQLGAAQRYHRWRVRAE